MSITKNPANVLSAYRLASCNDQSRAVLGTPDNFWLWSTEHGFDLTHPPSPEAEPVRDRIRLQCSLTPVVIDPAKTALIIIDMQNYNLAKELGNNVQAYFDAEEAILRYALPAARKAALQVVWLTWGLTDEDMEAMDPGPVRTFGWHTVKIPDAKPGRPGEDRRNDGELRNQGGIGDELGEVSLEDGTKVDGGRILFKGSWNAQMHGALHEAFVESASSSRPDVHIHKNSNSGMTDKTPELAEFLQREGIRTLLFTGTNTDQCVMGTLQDAYLKGFDTIMLKDGCATNSPEFAQLSAEHNCLRSWGFLSTCKDLADAAGLIEPATQGKI